jgi:hypothetical protein
MTIPLSSEVLYAFLMKQLGVIMMSQFHRILTYYPVPKSTPLPNEPDDERELDLLQMDRLLKWMELVFDDSFTPVSSPPSCPGTDESRRTYKQELFNIYRTLCSDYQQYCRWKAHNQSIWLFSSYRRQDTKGAARKLLSDIRLFKEGLQLYFMMDRKE